MEERRKIRSILKDIIEYMKTVKSSYNIGDIMGMVNHSYSLEDYYTEEVIEGLIKELYGKDSVVDGKVVL